MGTKIERKPSWLRVTLPGGENYTRLRDIINSKSLHTICTEARCPNIGECFNCGTATFLIMGNICTRNCLYCSVPGGEPGPADREEPARIAAAVESLSLKYAVITSVTRDDLPDGGASIFADSVHEIRKVSPECGIELLVPDFAGSMEESMDRIIAAKPDVLNHNIEVTENLFPELRPMGDYRLSLRLLKKSARAGLPTKSGLMIGFGETKDNILATLQDLAGSGCTLLTIGQYLRSDRNNAPVVKYYHPDEFEELKKEALAMGFTHVQSGPLVRSSYHAAEFIHGDR